MTYFVIEIDCGKQTEENLRDLYVRLGHLSLAVTLDMGIFPREMEVLLSGISELRQEVARTQREYGEALDSGASEEQAALSVRVDDLLALVNQFGREYRHNGERLCEVVIVE